VARLIIILASFLAGVLTAGYWFSQYHWNNSTLTRIPVLSFADGSVYSGDLSSDGRPHGEGVLEWPNSNIYQGAFEHGLFHGHGRLSYASGTVIEGQYQNGMANGKVEISYPDGSHYAGEVVNGLLHGVGEIHYSDGNVYSGEFVNDTLTGIGRWDVPETYHYSGEVAHGVFSGHGKIEYSDGSQYTGTFRKGLYHGQGSYVEADGARYSGEFIEGRFEGKGVYESASGESHSGEFVSWVPDGPGLATDALGNKYQGHFEQGMLEGDGTFVGSDGSRYKGDFVLGQFHGKGRHVGANGEIYEGEFLYGQRHGEGHLVYAQPVDGFESVKGQWHYGELVDTEDFAIYSGEDIAEHAIDHQQQKLNQALDSLAPGSPDQVEMYSLGVAAFGKEEVFRREIDFVERAMDKRFGVKDKGIYLVNSSRSLERWPLATTSALKSSLQAIGQAMNTQQDILFLYITSHGSSDHEISFQHKGLSLADLKPDQLRSWLDESGITWKVIVLSACYSGGFIDALKDEHTIVMTAAASDRPSFGCADNNTFTYFGEALFNYHFSNGLSFVDGFDKAKALITQWEIEQEQQPSNPQIYAPQKVVDYLDKWLPHLEGNAGVQ
jgi:hypothetical protein